jgi:hypothetical protein
MGAADKRRPHLDRRRVVVDLDGLQFEEMRNHAVHSGISLAAAVRELIEWGLQAHSDMERGRAHLRTLDHLKHANGNAALASAHGRAPAHVLNPSNPGKEPNEG